MLEHGQGKLIAPADVMVDELKDQTHTKLRQTLIDRILEDGELEERLEEEYDMLRPDIDEAINALTTSVTTALKKNPIQSWREPIANTAADIVETCDY
jgi:tRNA isopentenyl-2-thiomethyl-A-37 hydroxylase MiaE